MTETQKEQMFPQLAEELEPTPELGCHYRGAEILLPQGDGLASGHLVECSCNFDGNVIGRAHTNPILDTRMDQVEFAEGKVTELTTNIIAVSMYTQCNADENEYLFLNEFVISVRITREIPQDKADK